MRLQTILGVFMLLFAVGCVRQAGPTFEPIQSDTFPTFTPAGEVVAMGADSTATSTQPVLATTVETVAIATTPTATDAPTTLLATATSALPAITILPPTQTKTPVPNVTPTVLSVVAQGAGLSTAQPSATPIPPSSIGISPVEIATSTVVPSATPSSAPLQNTPSQTTLGDATSVEDATTCEYTVVRGDNLYRIAVNNNLTLEELRKANPNLTGDNPIINPGDSLNIPCDEQPTEEASLAQATPQSTALPTDVAEYTVVSGDTLLKIARKYNTTVTELQNLNKLTNPDLLSIGQVILVPATQPAN